MMKTHSPLMIVLCLITVLSCSTESTPTYTFNPERVRLPVTD